MSDSAPGLEGILPLDKPVGPTSHDMVAQVRKRLGIRRVGHTGTLDPLASGLLLMCLGRATRLAEYLGGFSKEYLAGARLGSTTTTDDAEGELTVRSDAWKGLARERVEDALRSLRGESLQVPPAFSAKKIRGEAAYSRARRGEEVTLEPVPILVDEIELTAFDLPRVEFRVVCSTGTYVRALARDLGARLDVGAHLVSLRRTAIGPFEVSGAISPDELTDAGAVRSRLVAPLEALAHMPALEVSEPDAARLQSGQALRIGDPPDAADWTRFAEAAELAVSSDSRLIAVAIREGDRIRPRKVFPAEGTMR